MKKKTTCNNYRILTPFCTLSPHPRIVLGGVGATATFFGSCPCLSTSTKGSQPQFSERSTSTEMQGKKEGKEQTHLYFSNNHNRYLESLTFNPASLHSTAVLENKSVHSPTFSPSPSMVLRFEAERIAAGES